jgi:hypothetical protein
LGLISTGKYPPLTLFIAPPSIGHLLESDPLFDIIVFANVDQILKAITSIVQQPEYATKRRQ